MNDGRKTLSPLVLYHGNCVDGFTAAWAAWTVHKDDAEYVPVQYGEPPPGWDDRHLNYGGRRVFIIDFSYPRNVLVEMHRLASELVVLDHHKTAEADLEGLDFCTFDMERSGAGMAWDYFQGRWDSDYPGKKRPWLINYVEDRDLWRWKLPDSRDVNAYIHVQERFFDRFDNLNNRGLEDALHNGRIVMDAHRAYVREVSGIAVVTDFVGCVVPVINAPFWRISELLELLATTPIDCRTIGVSWTEARLAPDEVKEQPPFAVGWYLRADGRVAYSLRSRDYPDGRPATDVSALAKRFGGGGHQRSAGFVGPMPVYLGTDSVEVGD